MEFNSPKERIAYYLSKGIIQDIYMSRLSYSLLMAVGRNGKKSEGSRYQQLFQDLQMVLSDHLIVHITKLFEKPDGRYEVISIPSTLQLISDNRATLEIIEGPLVGQHLLRLGVELAKPWQLSSQELSQIIVDFFDATMPSWENSTSLQALRLLRNKRIAHREVVDISGSPTTTFRDAFNLVKFAQNFAIVVGAAYTSTLHGFVNEDFFLGEDAERSSRALDHMVSQVLGATGTSAA
jgi:hypothetical protein